MSLVDCPECGERVSESAVSCGRCSYPVKENILTCPECGTTAFRGQAACRQCGCPVPRIGTRSAHDPAASKGAPTPQCESRSSVQVNIGHQSTDGVNQSVAIAQGMGAAMAMHKSYVGLSMLLLFVLYPLFYIPGLIMNFVYLGEAKRIRRQTGISPSGMTLLQLLIWFFFYIPLAGGIALLVVMLATGASFL